MLDFVSAITSVQKIANDFSVALTIKNANRVYFFANDYFLHSIGMKREEVVGRKDDDFLSPENALLSSKHDKDAFEKMHPIEYSQDIEFNGAQIKIYVLKWVIAFSNGEVFCLCTLVDFYHNKSKVLAFRERIDMLFEEIREEK